MKTKKRRELVLQEQLKDQVAEARETKLFKLGARWHRTTVALMAVTLFGYAVAIGMTALYLLS